MDCSSMDWSSIARLSVCHKLSDTSVALWVLLQTLIVAAIFLSLLLLEQNWK